MPSELTPCSRTPVAAHFGKDAFFVVYCRRLRPPEERQHHLRIRRRIRLQLVALYHQYVDIYGGKRLYSGVKGSASAIKAQDHSRVLGEVVWKHTKQIAASDAECYKAQVQAHFAPNSRPCTEERAQKAARKHSCLTWSLDDPKFV